MLKIAEGFILREVAGNYIVVAVGNKTKEFNGVINLNGTSAFMWKLLEKGTEKESLISAILEEYDVDKETATKDVEIFIDKLKKAKLLK